MDWTAKIIDERLDSMIAQSEIHPKRKLWVVVYRTGGTDNFQWHRSLPYLTRKEADESKAESERMGYPCMVEDYHLSMSIGVPDTFDAPR